MKRVQKQEIVNQIKMNCDVSDAAHRSDYSLCDILLRMRDLHHHENGLMPWETVDLHEHAEWVEKREDYWRSLEAAPYQDLQFDEQELNPFDVVAINEQLEREKWVYGAEYGISKKPNFFLGKVQEKKEADGVTIWHVSDEMCRDLSPRFVMFHEKNIFIRIDLLRMFLYHHYRELDSSGADGLIRKCFLKYGITDETEEPTVREKVREMVNDLIVLLEWHSVSKIRNRRVYAEWSRMLAGTFERTTELRLRDIQNFLADTDTSGALRTLCSFRKNEMLHLYPLLLDREKKELMPGFVETLLDSKEEVNWSRIERHLEEGFQKTTVLVESILSLWNENGDMAAVKQLMKRSFPTL